MLDNGYLIEVHIIERDTIIISVPILPTISIFHAYDRHVLDS
ncbi:hypothetical protein SLEP1_g34973 [Rubroshorea leprosula]|uniref:Uncharacterized protein n=1 Tax=Rubroshorea leprosula TaxID=152421 RepID=A0AAV5KLP8_9ROSI|nr:hypothetical protein SLEP1_g34973 [Rubroshorea leprosula]